MQDLICICNYALFICLNWCVKCCGWFSAPIFHPLLFSQYKHMLSSSQYKHVLSSFATIPGKEITSVCQQPQSTFIQCLLKAVEACEGRGDRLIEPGDAEFWVVCSLSREEGVHWEKHWNNRAWTWWKHEWDSWQLWFWFILNLSLTYSNKK